MFSAMVYTVALHCPTKALLAIHRSQTEAKILKKPN
jgi:hypothetical protein